MNFDAASNRSLSDRSSDKIQANAVPRLPPPSSPSPSKPAIVSKYIAASKDSMLPSKLSNKIVLRMKPSLSDPSSKASLDFKSKTSRQTDVREKIVSLLKTKISSIYKSKGDTKIDVEKFAEAVEQLLYRTASDFESYSDISTCDKRLRHLLTRLLKRRLQRCQSKNEKCDVSCPSSNS